MAAAVRSEQKALAIRLNADRVIVTSRRNLPSAHELGEQGHPVDLAIDCVGGRGCGPLPAPIQPGRPVDHDCHPGRQLTQVNLKSLHRGLRIIGSTLRPEGRR